MTERVILPNEGEPHEIYMIKLVRRDGGTEVWGRDYAGEGRSKERVREWNRRIVAWREAGRVGAIPDCPSDA